MKLVGFFLGRVSVSADYKNITALLNICMKQKIPYGDFKALPDKAVLSFTSASYKRVQSEAEKSGIELSVESRRGIPFICERYKYRHGIIVGVLIAVALVIISQKFVWSINVNGNENITSAEIIGMLRDEGFGVGSYIPKTNTDRLENKMLIDSELISWMSINIIGTHAEIQVREYEKPDEAEDKIQSANIVASKSGRIEEVRVYQGNVVAVAGTYVEKGDLLVSGLYDSERVGFRYTRASGEIMARTTSEFYIEIPYEYIGCEYTGAEYYDKYLNFFDFSIKISKNSGNVGAFYDKIDTVENCYLFGAVKTPFSLQTVKYMEYAEKTMYRTQIEAEELAYFYLADKLSDMSDDAIILRKTVIPEIREDCFAIFCTVVAIENIAEVVEFEVDLGIVDGKGNER